MLPARPRFNPDVYMKRCESRRSVNAIRPSVTVRLTHLTYSTYKTFRIDCIPSMITLEKTPLSKMFHVVCLSELTLIESLFPEGLRLHCGWDLHEWIDYLSAMRAMQALDCLVISL